MTPSAAGVGVQLHYLSSGEGQPLLAIHGIGAGAALLSDQLAGLTDHSRVITYDRRGYGKSEAPEPYLATTVIEQGMTQRRCCWRLARARRCWLALTLAR